MGQDNGAETKRQAARLIDADDSTLLDVLDNLLNKGVVLNADLILALANVDLVYVRLTALLCAADRILKPRLVTPLYVFALTDAAPPDRRTGSRWPHVSAIAGVFAALERRADVPPVELGTLKHTSGLSSGSPTACRPFCRSDTARC